MATTSRIYHSREDRINDLHTDEERVQYDPGDPARIEHLAGVLTEYSVALVLALGAYKTEIERPVDEDSESRMGYARRELIEQWALAQGAVSKVAWALRVNGNSAYERMIEALKTGAAVDMRGL